jgi:hypothetical protein
MDPCSQTGAVSPGLQGRLLNGVFGCHGIVQHAASEAVPGRKHLTEHNLKWPRPVS